MTPNNTISLESIDGFGPKGGENLAQAAQRLHSDCPDIPKLHMHHGTSSATFWWLNPAGEVVPFVDCSIKEKKVIKLVLRDVSAVHKEGFLSCYLNWVLREDRDRRPHNLSQKIAQLAIDVRNGKPADPITCGWSLLTDSKDHDGKHVSFELSYTDQNDIVNLTAIFNEA